MRLSSMLLSLEKSALLIFILAGANLALGGGVVLLAMKVFSSRDNTVLVPPNLASKAVVGQTWASAEYHRYWALYLAQTVGSITPQNIDLVLDAVSWLLEPKIATSVRTKLRAVADDPVFRNSGGASWFEGRTVYYDPQTGRTFVTGVFNVTSAGRQMPQTTPVVYEMKFEMRAGHPVATEFDSYEGSEPRTAQWLEQHQNDPKPKQEAGDETH